MREAYPHSLALYDGIRQQGGQRNLLFFLGAVKDMTPEESRASGLST